jgi:large subunit ribosomal protein L29
MKSKDILKKINGMTTEAIGKDLHEAQIKLNTLIFDRSRGKLNNVRELSKLKKDIARMHTVLRIKEDEDK